MYSELIFQLITSTIASFCCGISLLLWLLSIKAFTLPKSSREYFIFSQLAIGGTAFLGLILSIPLVLFESKRTEDLSWPILHQEIGCVFLLLGLSEYLSVCTLQSLLTHMMFALLFVGAMIFLSLSMYLSEHRHTLFSSYMVMALASLSFVHAQIFRAWVICKRSWHPQTSTFEVFWRFPDLTTTRHQRALWASSASSMGQWLLLLGLIILACVKPNLQTQVATLQIVIISLRKAAVSFYIFRVSESDMDL